MEPDMILAIDTSTAWCGLALYRPGEVIAEAIWKTQSYHTAHLAPTLEHLLRLSGVSTRDLQGVAVALGPGSFTALRVGVALAKGLCLVLQVPIAGVPTLDVLAAAQAPRRGFQSLIAALQAGRGRLAVARYTPENGRWKASESPKLVTLEALLDMLELPTLLCGEFTPEQRRQLEKHPLVFLPAASACVRRPAVLAELGWQKIQQGKADPLASLAPIYLHLTENA
jgi:tRNA threonylcarbamoyladenosine biosynthesis protein TsaB